MDQQARVQLYLYDTSGALVAIFDEWNTLQLERRLNTYDTMTLSISGDDPRRALFTTDAFIEVRRRIPGQEWYTESTLMHQSPEDQITEANRQLYTSYSRGLVDLIRRRELLYYANTPYTLKGGFGESVIKAFVSENAGPLATTPPRLAAGVTFGLEIEYDYARGLQWAGQRSWQNLLDTIQEIAGLTSVDFDVIKTGPQAFEFRCYYPQRGTDRRTTVTFSPTLANMLAPSYTISRTEEITRVVVLGPGQETDRRVVVRDSTAVSASPWRVIETTYDARKESTYDGLVAAGDAQLVKLQAQEAFNFQVLQTSGAQYGRDYFLGDIVSAGFGNVSTVKKITGVSLNIQDGRENISMEFATVPKK